MFNKLLNKWKTNRKVKLQKKKRLIVYKHLREGYTFLKWAEGKFPNRKSRKQFYQDIFHNGIIHSRFVDMFTRVIDEYLDNKKEKKNEPDRKV